MGHVVATYDQDSFRGRNDDGSESAATWKAAANTNWTQNVDENFRVRILVQETAGGAEVNKGVQWQYNLNSAGWNNITTSSAVVKAVNSSNLTDGEDTTQQLGAGTFIVTNEGVTEDGLNVGVADFNGNDETEFELSAQIVSADVVDNDSIQIRLVDEDGTTALDNYTNTPTITVNEANISTVAPAKGLLQVKGYSAKVLSVKSPAPAKGLLQVKGNVVFVGHVDTDTDVVRGILSFKGNLPVIRTVARIDPVKGLLVFRQYPVDHEHVSKLTVSKGTLRYKGYTPTVTVPTSATTVVPLKGLLQYKGYLPTASGVATVAPVRGRVRYKGYTPATTAIPGIRPLSGRLRVKGYSPVTQRVVAKTVQKGLLQYKGYLPTTTSGVGVIVQPVAGKLIFKSYVPEVTGFDWKPTTPAAGDWSAVASSSEEWSSIDAVVDF